ncbi:MAG: SDR family NAD(P)-dependent oxidoreductase [Nitrososphaerales archaeon]
MKEQSDLRKLFDLSGKVAIVTGASGMLGSEIASALASCGADVVVSGRNVEKLRAAAEKIRSFGRKTLEVKTDVTSESDLGKLASETMHAFGKIDILVACAGANILKPAKDYPAADFDRLLRINSLGTFLTNKEIGKKMLEQRHGKIINVSSVRGAFATSANAVGYSASKAAVNMITKQLACEWAKFNITVNAIAPAMVATGMHTASPDGEILHLDPKVLEGITKRTPMKRLAQPIDVVGSVIFLASDASNFITGQILYIDGGATAWAA